MQSIQLIRQFLQDRVGTEPGAVVEDALLTDLGVDSLMLAELMFEAEDRLGITIEDTTAVPKTVGDLITVIEAQLAIKASAPSS